MRSIARILPGLRDELGDLLLQVVFHARMAEEQGAFDFGDVVEAICDKMVRRHPHVFADEQVGDAKAQTVAWEEHKRRERDAAGHEDTSALAGIARGLPEWQRAVKLQHKAAKVGFDWPGPEPVIEKLHEEIDEVRAEFDAVAIDPTDAFARDRLEDEIGDLLFVCANIARHAKVDVGSALRRANLKFERRFRMMEVMAEAEGDPSVDAAAGWAGRLLESCEAAGVEVKFASFREFYPFYLGRARERGVPAAAFRRELRGVGVDRWRDRDRECVVVFGGAWLRVWVRLGRALFLRTQSACDVQASDLFVRRRLGDVCRCVARAREALARRASLCVISAPGGALMGFE